MKTFLSKSAIFISFLYTALTSSDEESEVVLFGEPADSVDKENIRIKSGTITTEITGECIWETMIDDGFIFMSDKTNNSKGLIISFNTMNPPTTTTTYKIVKNGFGKNPKHIDIVFSDYKTENTKTGILQWSSTDESGELTLVVEGDKITADLDGIVLYPRLESNGFKSLNVGEYAKSGVLYGSFTMDRVSV